MKRANGLDIPRPCPSCSSRPPPHFLVYDMQVGIVGCIPIVIEDACGAGHEEAGQRAIASLRYLGDAVFTTVHAVTTTLQAIGVRTA